MCKHLEWSDFKLLRSFLVFIMTQSWMKSSLPSARANFSDSDEYEGFDDFAEVKECHFSHHLRLPSSA